MSVLEEMAQSRPIVATALGGIPELIADPESGLLVPAKNPRKLTQAIVQLLENKN